MTKTAWMRCRGHFVFWSNLAWFVIELFIFACQVPSQIILTFDYPAELHGNWLIHVGTVNIFAFPVFGFRGPNCEMVVTLSKINASGMPGCRTVKLTLGAWVPGLRFSELSYQLSVACHPDP
jgi:hypothetical protein